MSALTLPRLLVEARPTATEVAILALPVGAGARVHHPDGVREYEPAIDDVPYYVVVPGDKDAIGWGWAVGWFGGLSGIRNGRHRLDRDAWHEAAKALKAGGVAYVMYEARDYFGKPRWTATGVRWTALSVPAEQIGANA